MKVLFVTSPHDFNATLFEDECIGMSFNEVERNLPSLVNTVRINEESDEEFNAEIRELNIDKEAFDAICRTIGDYDKRKHNNVYLEGHQF